MGTFMSKEELHSEATRLGVELEGLTWAQQQKAVLDAKKEQGEDIHYVDKKVEERKLARQIVTDNKLPDIEYVISPEIAPVANQVVKYDEELGYEDLETTEVSYLNESFGERNVASATYRTKGTGRKVVAQSTAPKENCGIVYNPQRDFVPRTTWQGRVGYIYSHPSLPCVKNLLIQSGYFEDYRAELTNPKANYLWYAAGKILTIDINKTHQILKDIEAKYKREHGE